MNYIRFKDIIIRTQYGYTAEKTSTEEGIYKYLRITDIVPYFVNFNEVPFALIPEEKAAQYLVRENDILIARTGATTGYNYVVPKGIKNTIFASYLIRFIVDQNKIHPPFLKFVFKSKAYYGFINNYIGGSAQPGMNAKVFGKFLIPNLPLPKQKKVASVLSAYDNLIENNNKRIKLLEQIAENLYKEWFVRFRFPGHEKVEMVDGIPKGWREGRLCDICMFERGKNITAAEMIDGEIPVISAGISPSGFHQKYNVEGPAITISSSGANAGFLAIHYQNIWAADCSFVSDKDSPFIYYLYELLNSLRIVISNLQRGAAQPHVYPKDLNRLKITIPSIEIIMKANERLSLLHRQIGKLNAQTTLLTQQRDRLLPRLMSGKLEIKLS